MEKRSRAWLVLDLIGSGKCEARRCESCLQVALILPHRTEYLRGDKSAAARDCP